MAPSFICLRDVLKWCPTTTKILNIAKGLEMMHNKGIVHGDFKPENCIEIDNTYKIIDMDTSTYIKTNNPKRKGLINKIMISYMYIYYPSLLSVSLYLIQNDKLKY